MSCVLTTRSLRPVSVTAMVCALSMASLSRISTSDGGTSTPSVEATAITASRVAAGMPSAFSRGATTRDRPSTLAPTEPFIGPEQRAEDHAGDQRRRRPPRQHRVAVR